MPHIGIATAHAVGHHVVEVGYLEALRGHQLGFGTHLYAVFRVAYDIHFLVGIEAAAGLLVGEEYDVVDAEGHLAVSDDRA